MAKKRVAVEFGLGTDLRGEDYTKAAVRALWDALLHNSLTMADAFGFPKEAMIVDVEIGVARPEEVDKEAVAAILPYGKANSVTVVKGGLDVEKDDGRGRTVMANAAAVVYFDMEEVTS